MRKASKRVFLMYQLKRSGVSQKDLLRIYLSVIRPTVEYACQVWHPGLPAYLSNSIEAIQKRSLRVIYPGTPYIEALSMADIPTLQNRRSTLCHDYFRKLEDPNHRLHHLLPEQHKSKYQLRANRKYPLPKARTNRYKNSLIPWCIYKQ